MERLNKDIQLKLFCSWIVSLSFLTALYFRLSGSHDYCFDGTVQSHHLRNEKKYI